MTRGRRGALQEEFIIVANQTNRVYSDSLACRSSPVSLTTGNMRGLKTWITLFSDVVPRHFLGVFCYKIDTFDLFFVFF